MAGEPEPMPYPQVEQQPELPALEEQILDFWAADGTFAASVGAREAGPNEYVFYDGPPFANGLPHYGHLLTGFVKDAVPRYRTMRGRRVERRFGWDCHGLPAEMEAEKELGISGRATIVDFGVARFNDYCRTSVLRYTNEWRRYVTRQARWLERAERVGTVKGADLVGHSYRPLFPFFADHPGAFRVLAGDFVNTDEGTGTVHIAPGFGEDDQRICEENGIALVVPVDGRGR